MSMTTGLLWFDKDDARSFEEKVRNAVNHYAVKHGELPEYCYIHPNMLPQAVEVGSQVAGVRIEVMDTILPYHYWLGRKDDNG